MAQAKSSASSAAFGAATTDSLRVANETARAQRAIAVVLVFSSIPAFGGDAVDFVFSSIPTSGGNAVVPVFSPIPTLGGSPVAPVLSWKPTKRRTPANFGTSGKIRPLSTRDAAVGAVRSEERRVGTER